MADRSVVVRLKAVIADFEREMAKAEKATKRVADESESTSKRSRSAFGDLAEAARTNEGDWNRVGGALLGVGASAVAGGALAVKSFAEFERAMSAAQAATRATGTELDALEDAALDAGARTQYSATEAAEAIMAMGKAGVSTTDILRGGLDGALDLAAAGQLEVGQAAEIAATAMIQFGLSGREIPHVADLLAAGAGKAQGEVTDLANALKYVGPVAAGMNVSIEETTGTLAAFASQGIIGEQAGTALRGMLSSLTSPSAAASNEIERLGITLYDAEGSFLGLQNAAGELQAAYGPMTDAQRDASLGILFGNEQVTAARVLYQQGAEGVADWTAAVDDSGFAAAQAAALTDNLAGDVERLGGALSTALITAGAQGGGALRDLTQDVTSLVDIFNDLPDGAQTATTTIAGISGAAALAGGAALVAVPQIVSLYDSVGRLGSVGASAQTGLRGIGTFLTGPWGLAVAGGALILGGFVKAQIDARQRVDELAGALDGQTGAVTDNARAIVVKQLAEQGMLRIAQDLGFNLETVTDAALGNAGAMREVNREVNDAADRLYAAQGGFAAMGGEIDPIADRLGGFQTALAKSAETTTLAQAEARRTAEAMGEQGAATDLAAAAAGGLQGAMAATPDAAAIMTGAVDASTTSLGLSLDVLEDWINTAATIGDAWTSPIAVYQELLAGKDEAERVSAQTTADATSSAGDSWEDYATRSVVSLSEFAQALEQQVANQRDWETNLVTVTGRAGLQVGQILQNMGAEGVDIVAAMATGTDEEVQRMAAALVDEATAGGRGATEALATEMAVMAAVGRAGAKTTAQDIAEELGIGVSTVAQIAAEYGVELAGGINPLLEGLGKAKINVTRGKANANKNATGYADGGIEDHTAQIAAGGEWRLWAEPETPGEAYIPQPIRQRHHTQESHP